MKRILTLIIFAISVPFFAHAQKYYELGLGLSDVIGNFPETGSRLSVSLGIGYDYAFKGDWSVDSKVLCAMNGKSKYGALFLSIPVTANYHIDRFELGIGPYVSCNIVDINHNPDKYYDWNPEVEYKPYLTTYSGYFTRLDFGACCRVRYGISTRHIGLEAYMGALNCGKKYDGEMPINGHTVIINVTYGVKF